MKTVVVSFVEDKMIAVQQDRQEANWVLLDNYKPASLYLGYEEVPVVVSRIE